MALKTAEMNALDVQALEAIEAIEVKQVEKHSDKHGDKHTFRLPEAVTLNTVADILRQVEGGGKPPQVVDFSAVTQADSAALALLLRWQAQSLQPLQVIALPSNLQTLLPLYDLEQVWQLADTHEKVE